MYLTFLFLFSKVENILFDFSFSSRKWRNCFHFLFLFLKLENRKSISLSPLESWEYSFRFLYFFSKLEKGISGFSFFSRNWRNEFQISLSLLDWTFWPLVNDWLLAVRSSWCRLAETRVSERRRESKVEGSSISASWQLPLLIEQIVTQEEEQIDDHDGDDDNYDKYEGWPCDKSMTKFWIKSTVCILVF